MSRIPPVALTERVRVTGEKLVAGGDGLARVEGFPLFIRGLYPGDVAEVEVTEIKKGFGRGEVANLLQPSVQRRLEPCPIAAACGGCDWTSLRLDHQLEAKRQILLDSLTRTGKLGMDQIPSIRIHPSPLNYRLRSRLHVGPQGEIGFFARGSNEVVPLSKECEVVGPAVIEQYEQLLAYARAARPEHIATFETGDSFIGHAVSDESEDSVREAGRDVEVRAGGWRFSLSTTGFFQVNRHLLPLLIHLVENYGRAARRHDLAFDLYGGVGFFALPLASIFRNVVSVESSPISAPYAQRNAATSSGVEIVTETVERFLRTESRRPDFVMVDPPRAGMSHDVLSGIARLQPPAICYLSCDPVTFARDVATLVRRGWRLSTLHLVDLFPNTHHIETLASLESGE